MRISKCLLAMNALGRPNVMNGHSLVSHLMYEYDREGHCNVYRGGMYSCGASDGDQGRSRADDSCYKLSLWPTFPSKSMRPAHCAVLFFSLLHVKKAKSICIRSKKCRLPRQCTSGPPSSNLSFRALELTKG